MSRRERGSRAVLLGLKLGLVVALVSVVVSSFSPSVMWWADFSLSYLCRQEVFPNTVRRLCRVEDVAALVTFLASPLAGYINGVNLRIDGGYVGTL